MSANAARLDRARAKTRKALDSGFCEAGNCDYCRKADCSHHCHTKTSDAGVNVTDSVSQSADVGTKAVTTASLREPDRPAPASALIRDAAHFDPANPAGVWRGIREDVYHGDTTTLSASSAKVLLGKRSPTDSWALRFGSLCHVVLLEPHRLDEYVVLDAAAIAGNNPKTNKPYDAPTMTTKWKTAVAEAEQDGLTVVSQEDWDKAHAIVDAVQKHPTARQLLDASTERELSAYALHETGAMVRGRFDLFGPGLISDLKTITNGDPAAFGKTCHEFGYHISAANYLDLAAANGLDVEGFAFINAEKEPTPGGKYRISVIELQPRAIELGREQMAEACRRWIANGRVVDLPDYGTGFHRVDLPEYAYRRNGATTYEEIPA